MLVLLCILFLGWETTYQCITDLYADFKHVEAKSKEDDKEDKDGDGMLLLLKLNASCIYFLLYICIYF